jgi:hypothetical protein
VAEHCFCHGLRNNIQIELCTLYCIDGQTGAIDANAALVGDISGQLIWRAKHYADRASILTETHNLADTIDMATDNMPTQSTLRRQRFF